MAGSQNGSKEEASVGEKHQTEHESPDAKRSKTTRQTTLEETLPKDDGETKETKEETKDGKNPGDEMPKKEEAEDEQNGSAVTKGGSAVKPGEEEDVPSSILEKGIIYFFIRGRVGIEEPEEVNDIARSYMLLRPIEKDAKLGDGPIGDAGNTRILALPKKVFPASGKDRFMVFVDKVGASYEEIKKEFLDSNDYTTKTMGDRHTPAAAPIGEGVYAITTTGRESHLAYMMTLPEKLGEVQEEIGLKEKGSFILSTKNPQAGGPANAQLPEGADFSKEIMDEFRSLRWMPTKPEHLDYVNAQCLFIGESSGIEPALEPQKKDEKQGKNKPLEVLENLEEEDLKRMKHLPGDQSSSIFTDLDARAKDYPKLQTTF